MSQKSTRWMMVWGEWNLESWRYMHLSDHRLDCLYFPASRLLASINSGICHRLCAFSQSQPYLNSSKSSPPPGGDPPINIFSSPTMFEDICETIQGKFLSRRQRSISPRQSD